MSPKIAVLRLAFLLVVWFAVSANGALVFAQPGSTGGTVGKTNKSVSEGENAASPAQRSTNRPHSEGHETKSKSERKRITRDSEGSRPTRSPAAASQVPLSQGDHGNKPPSTGCPGQIGGDARAVSLPCN
jgi:hypothetical protein